MDISSEFNSFDDLSIVNKIYEYNSVNCVMQGYKNYSEVMKSWKLVLLAIRRKGYHKTGSTNDCHFVNLGVAFLLELEEIEIQD